MPVLCWVVNPWVHGLLQYIFLYQDSRVVAVHSCTMKTHQLLDQRQQGPSTAVHPDRKQIHEEAEKGTAPPRSRLTTAAATARSLKSLRHRGLNVVAMTHV